MVDASHAEALNRLADAVTLAASRAEDAGLSSAQIARELRRLAKEIEEEG